MRKPWRRCPQLESLESMTLLSGVSGMVAHPLPVVAMETAAPNIPVPANQILGTVRGAYFQHRSNPDTGSTIGFYAFGRLNPLGRTFEVGNIQTPGNIIAPATGSVTIYAPKGTVTLQLTQTPTPTASAVSPNQLDFNYTVTATTGSVNVAKTGTVDVTLHPRIGKSATPVFNSFGSVTVVYGTSAPATA